MPHPPQNEALQYALAAGIPILTPNERSARDLRAQYDLAQQSVGLTAWTPANVLSFNNWLASQWSRLITEGAEPRLLLNTAQEHLLWREAIESGPALDTLGEIDSLATLAATAWALAATHLCTAELRSRALTHDSKTFAAWAAGFRKRCDTRGYLPAAELPTALREHLEDRTLTAPPELILLGLAAEPPTPSRAALLNALADHGCKLTHLSPPPATPHVHTVVAAGNPQLEAETAAHWIRHFIQTRATAGLPHRVAVLVPRLAEDRESLEATFRALLAPELQHIAADNSAAPYTFSSTPALVDAPMIATALDLVRWATAPLDLETVSALLLSPYIGTSADLPARAEFDAFTLRAAPLLRPELDIAAVARLATHNNRHKPTPPAISALLQQIRSIAHRVNESGPRSYADWTEAVRSILRSADWPGDRPLTAAEFAHAQAWEHVLDSIATLDFQGARVDFRTALAAVTRQARTAAAPITAANAPIQIMQPAEAAGSAFDAVVFLHATDANWPAAERPHPLLPWSLQRDRHMPGTVPADTTARAAQLTASIAAATPTLLCFYAEQDADGEQRLSPIIATLGLQSLTAADLLPPPRPAVLLTEELVEDTAPLPPLPSTSVRGGATVLQLQAACAFHAFAELRLNANAPEAGAHGFDSGELGSFLHAALDAFWRNVRTQNDLRDMTLDARRETLRASVAHAFRHVPPAESDWDKAYVALQKDRMVTVLAQWLDHELKRGPFEVLEREKKHNLTLGPISLEIRLDRIDRVDGGTLLVDYKTGGSAHPKGWTGDRPDEPQLPLYALLPEADGLQGLTFAKVRVGKDMKWQGHSPQGILPKPAPAPYSDIETQREEWRITLEALATDFYNGRADVSPKDYPRTCTYCAHRLLCRITSAALETADIDADEAEDADA